VSVKQHTSFSAEIYVMGILPEMHRQGIGRALIDHAQEWLTNQGIEYLQVKTLGPSQPDVNYARTRSFYEAMGFRPLEEIKQVWDDQNPCLITDHSRNRSPFAEMDFEIVNYLDFLPHLRVKNGSSPTWFTHLMASPRITPAEWESNPGLRPLLRPKWGKEFTFAN